MGNPHESHICFCKFNPGVNCLELEEGKEKCACCGWNPKVEEQRRKDIFRRFDIRALCQRMDDLYRDFRAGRITQEEAFVQFDDAKFAMLGRPRKA